MTSSEPNATNDDRASRICQLVDEYLVDTAANETEIIAAHPDLMPELAEQLKVGRMIRRAQDEAHAETEGVPITEEPTPESIGRYQVRHQLGAGAFGRVYLAHDGQLDRLVAIKVPNQRLFHNAIRPEVFLAEARYAAKVHHPRLVAIYDAQIENGQPYVVQQYVDGTNLADWLRYQEEMTPLKRSVALLTDVAAALQAIHASGLVHRDLKPANILLDIEGQPYVADFGLALHESVQRQRQGEIVGTPAYMSPEQIRGESHLLDGRTDLWSWGVMLYELLVGDRPFTGATRDELFAEIQHRDPKPPCMARPGAGIETELERICLKCLQKRARDRYDSAAKLIDDLQHWLEADRPRAGRSDGVVRIVPKGLRSFDARDADFFLDLLPGPRDREGLPDSIRFWKSLIEDADPAATFRVGLIYGPSGCGKSSFVKAGLIPRLEHVIWIYLEATPEETERRLWKAIAKHCPHAKLDDGLVEAVRSLRERDPQQPKIVLVIDQFEQWLYAHRETSSSELVDALRQCDGGQVQCILMVRDDFWMAISGLMNELEVAIGSHNSAAVNLFDLRHAKKVLIALGRAFDRLPPDPDQGLSHQQEDFISQAVTDLSQEGKVICVRLSLFADMMKGRPWTPAELKKVGGTEGVGATFLEETFSATTAPPQHRLHQEAARAVLAALLPAAGTEIKGHMRSREELLTAANYGQRLQEFDQLLSILDRDLRLITPTDPDAIDGADESSSHGGDRGSRRYYQLTHDYLVPSLRKWLTRKQKETRRGRAELQLADRAMLWNNKPETKLLPGMWEHLKFWTLTDRQKWTASETRMMRAAGRKHAVRTVTVAVLLALGVWGGRQIASRSQAQSLVNQLTTAKPSEVGLIAEQLQPHLAVAAAELKGLLERPAESTKQRQQQLHARIALMTSDKTQVPPLMESLLTEQPAYIGVIRDALKPHQQAVTTSLWDVLARKTEPAGRRFRAALALADYDPDSESWSADSTEFVARHLVDFNPEHQPSLREYLRPIRLKLLEDLEVLYHQADASETQLMASAALADFIDEHEIRLASLLVTATPKQYDILWPRLAGSTNPELVKYLDDQLRQQPTEDTSSLDRVTLGRRRAGAAITRVRQGAHQQILPIYQFTDDPEAMTQFIHRQKSRGVRVEHLLEMLTHVPPPASGSTPSFSPGGEGGRRPDEGVEPGDRPQFPTGQDVSRPWQELHAHRARYALLLALGEFPLTDIPETDRGPFIAQLADWYQHDPSSGIHGAAGWLLQQWGQADIVREVDQTPVPYAPDREWFTMKIVTKPPKDITGAAKNGLQNLANDELSDEQDRVDQQAGESDAEEEDNGKQDDKQRFAKPAFTSKSLYMTFIVFQPGTYSVGSPEDEPGRQTHEAAHDVVLTRPFAILDREVTFAEMMACQESGALPSGQRTYESIIPEYAEYGFSADTAVVGPAWYDAVRFCRWLTQQVGWSECEQCYADPAALDPELFPVDKAAEAPRNWPRRSEAMLGFRLPTDHEWEVACRCGGRSAYAFGGDVTLLGHYGWFRLNSGMSLHVPKTRRPSLRGLFDVHGNVHEWCHDWHSAYPADTVTDPVGPAERKFRVERGGSWKVGAETCRSAFRHPASPTVTSDTVGFRIALVPSLASPPSVTETLSEYREASNGVDELIGGDAGD